MYEYKKNEKVMVKSHGYKDDGCNIIKIEVFDVPFMTGWRDAENTSKLECVLEAIIHHFGSLSADIHTEIVRAYRHAIGEVK